MTAVPEAREISAVLRAEGVRKSFGEHEVLRGIDLDVAEAEVVCLIGASGSGKSTFLRCLNGLERVSDGSIWLGDREVTDPRTDEDEIRRDVGIVFQAYNLFPHLSVLDNIALAPVKVRGHSRKEALATAEQLLERVGLADKAKAHPDSLSGGQQQRVALVRAIAMRPQVLLLDEITSALDPMLVGEVLDVVREIKAEGQAIVMATHEIGFAREAADRVAFLKDGVIVEIGPDVASDPQRPETQEFLARYL